MINFYGVFQLVKVNKEDKTKKNGDTIVYFTAATNRGEDKTDFKLFKIIGRNADYMIRNLQKVDGKYKSRKMFLQGYVETYKENKDVEVVASVKKEKIPEQIGYIKSNLKVKCTNTIQIERDTYVVRSIEFVDKKRDEEVEIYINDNEDDIVSVESFISDADDIEDDIEFKEGTNNKTNKNVGSEIQKAMENMDRIKNEFIC